MKSLKSIVVALCAAVVLMGCNMNNTTKGAAIGAGGGAALVMWVLVQPSVVR